MQCYERQAMYFKLNADAVGIIPKRQFDPDLVEDALSYFSIQSFEQLISLNSHQQRELLLYLWEITQNQETSDDKLAAAPSLRKWASSGVHFFSSRGAFFST